MLTAIDQKWHKNHIYNYSDLELLKVAAVYGANGAGKSNFIKAINAFRYLVTGEASNALSNIKKFKLDPQYKYLPTSFEIEFIKNDQAYIYGVEVESDIILGEWLYISGVGKNEDELLFSRKSSENENEIVFSEKYTQTDEDKFRLKFYQNEYLKKDDLLLKELFSLKEGFQEVKEVHNWFKNDLIVIFPTSKPKELIKQLSTSEKFKDFTDLLICSFHTGISKLDISKYPLEEFFSNFGKRDLEREAEVKDELKKGKPVTLMSFSKLGPDEEVVAMLENDEPVVQRLTSKHENRNKELVDFYLSEESDGTKRLLDLIPGIFSALMREVTVFVDEIDQSIHPSLLKELIDKFVSNNETKGQLIFSTHESNLLDQNIFRRDEIWFVEKDHGETMMYPLSNYDIRVDLDIRKGYLNGRFGAIPFLGNLKDLNWNTYADSKKAIQ